MIDPTESELATAISEVSVTFQAGDPTGRNVLDRVAAEPEGSASAGGLESVVWWCDYQGRKHVRVAAGGLDLPPLWHICPERVHCVRRGNAEPTWLVACGCGAVGTPEEVAWMGDRCGPCHDRHEDGERGEAAPTRLDMRGVVRALAFAPDGERLAVSAGDRLSVVDLARGIGTVIAHGTDDDCPHPLAFSPDGRSLAAGDPGAGRLLIWDAERGEQEHDFDSGASLTEVAFSPDGRFLGAAADDLEFRLLARTDDGWDDRFGPVEGVFCFAFSPDSRTVALGMDGESIAIHDAETLAQRRRVELRRGSDDAVLHVQFGPSGDDVVTLAGNDGAQGGESWRLRRGSLAKRDGAQSDAFPAASSFAASPDGRYLAALHGQLPSIVHFWDLQLCLDIGSLESNLEGQLTCLVLSPDGRTLATGSAGGVVKLWPWRALLEGRS